MIIQDALGRMPLPKVYQRCGKDCFFDSHRNKLIEITPEEIVRQKMLKYCEVVLGVPYDVLLVEEPVSHYAPGVPGRIDIVINEITKDDQGNYTLLSPVTVIECKNPSVVLSDSVTNQAIRYCDDIGAKYIIVTNGIELTMVAYSEEKDIYQKIDGILSYQQMVDGNYRLSEHIQAQPRFDLHQLSDIHMLDRFNKEGYQIYGNNTPDILKSSIVNLYQALMEVEYKLPVLHGKGFELIEDIGVRFLDYTNAGAGHYAGDYRSFLVKDQNNEAQIVSIGLFGTDPHFRNESRSSYTSMIVAVDRFKTSHSSLQYNVDRYAVKEGNTIVFFHNGVISGQKAQRVRDYIHENGKCVVASHDTIYLGKLQTDHLFHLDDIDVSALIYSLIEYALLREDLRRMIRNFS